MKELFIKHLESIVPDAKTARFLLAVSGGIDSSVMTHLFYTNNLHFDIAHCNFHLRGEDSNLDMNFVQNTLIQSIENGYYRIPKIIIKEFDTFKLQKKSGSSIEMIARELRYNWFNELAPDYDYICTAHHINDNVETLLLNLVRGTGYKGLNGIPERNQLFIRPLLDFTSEQINQYASENNIPFRVDLSNLSNDYQRNKIRNNVIPVLQEINPGLLQTITRDIKLFNKQYQFYNHQINQIKAKLLIKERNLFKINIADLLKELTPELILYEILDDFQFNYSTTIQIFKRIMGESGKQFFSDQFFLVKDREFLIIYPREALPNDLIIRISEPGDFEKIGFEYCEIPNSSSFLFENNPLIAYFDADSVKFPLIIRTWKKGDYFYPFGLKGKKKLSDLFTDLKLNLIQKKQVKILCEESDSNPILWVIGFRTDDRYKVGTHTKHIFILKVKSL